MASIVFRTSRNQYGQLVDPHLEIWKGNCITVTAYSKENDLKVTIPHYSAFKDNEIMSCLKLTDREIEFEVTEMGDPKAQPIKINFEDIFTNTGLYESAGPEHIVTRMWKLPKFRDLCTAAKAYNVMAFVVKSDIYAYISPIKMFTNDISKWIYCITTSKPMTIPHEIDKSMVNRVVWNFADGYDANSMRHIVNAKFGYDGLHLVGYFKSIMKACAANEDMYKKINKGEEVSFNSAYTVEDQSKCDICGSSNAMYVKDPYKYTGWLCPKCHDEVYSC